MGLGKQAHLSHKWNWLQGPTCVKWLFEGMVSFSSVASFFFFI